MGSERIRKISIKPPKIWNGAIKVGVTPRAQPRAGERLRQHREQIESEDRSKLPPDCYK